jgi:hypothetical protein
MDIHWLPLARSRGDFLEWAAGLDREEGLLTGKSVICRDFGIAWGSYKSDAHSFFLFFQIDENSRLTLLIAPNKKLFVLGLIKGTTRAGITAPAGSQASTRFPSAVMFACSIPIKVSSHSLVRAWVSGSFINSIKSSSVNFRPIPVSRASATDKAWLQTVLASPNPNRLVDLLLVQNHQSLFDL